LCVDVRHARDEARTAALDRIRSRAGQLAARRAVGFAVTEEEHHPAVRADRRLSDLLGRAVTMSGQSLFQIPSGAGHDAGVMAAVAPWAMLFLRSPGGVSHCPDECVLPGDVGVALDVVMRFLDLLAERDTFENGVVRSLNLPGAS
jgi:allantoate deiminase